MSPEQKVIVDQGERLTQPGFYKFVIDGKRPFDSGDVHLQFSEPGNKDCFSSVNLRVKNLPKKGVEHSGDFACVTVRTTGPYPLVVVDAICADGFSSPDFSGEGLAPEALFSEALIGAAKADGFAKQIQKLGDSHDFDTFNPSLREPYYGKSRTVGLRESWFNENGFFDVKKYLREKYISWMVEELQRRIRTEENHSVHWYAGVYGVFHIVCDPHQNLIHYLFLGSGDVEAYLTQYRRRFKPLYLYEDSNWSADRMGQVLGIQGASRYPGKVYEIYDAVGPLSDERVGPFTLSIGYIRNFAGFYLRSDGCKAKPGEDDATFIDIRASATS